MLPTECRMRMRPASEATLLPLLAGRAAGAPPRHRPSAAPRASTWACSRSPGLAGRPGRGGGHDLAARAFPGRARAPRSRSRRATGRWRSSRLRLARVMPACFPTSCSSRSPAPSRRWSRAPSRVSRWSRRWPWPGPAREDPALPHRAGGDQRRQRGNLSPVSAVGAIASTKMAEAGRPCLQGLR